MAGKASYPLASTRITVPTLAGRNACRDFLMMLVPAAVSVVDGLAFTGIFEF